MRTFLVGGLGLAAFIGAAATVSQLDQSANTAQGPRSGVYLGFDVSSSYDASDPNLQAFMNQTSDYAYGAIREMAVGSVFDARTLGDYGPAAVNRITLRLSDKMPAEIAARSAGQLIAQMPAKVASGEWKPAQNTNALWTLRKMAEDARCADTGAVLILITDGVEHSEYTSGRAVIEGTAVLPPFEDGVLVGCRVRMFGVGQSVNGGSLTVTDNIRGVWAAFFDASGVDDVLISDTVATWEGWN